MKKRIQEGIHQLTDEELLALGNKIVSTSMIPTIWHQKTGQTFSRTAPLQARRKRRITPMGQNRSTLYFWRDEVERAAIPQEKKRGRPSKNTKNDENVDPEKLVSKPIDISSS